MMSFEEWYDIFVDKCRSLDYYGPIDKWTFEEDYLLDKTPEEAAEEFVAEMMDDE